MRIFKAFIIILASVILFLMPLTSSMYDFQTDLQTDLFSSSTGVGETSENVSLSESIYESDTTTIDISSDSGSDSPAWNAYDAGSNTLNIIGLSANNTRTLTVQYDIDALDGSDAINNLADRMAWIWLLVIIAFAPAALVAIFRGEK